MSQYDAVFLEKSDFFLVQSGEFYQVTSAKQAIDVLGLDPKSTKKQLRAAGLNFKQSPEKYLEFLVTQTSAN